MNNIKKILAEQEEEIRRIIIENKDNAFEDRGYMQEHNVIEFFQRFLRQSQKELIKLVVKELVGEEKMAGRVSEEYDSEEDEMEDYIRIKGYNQHRTEVKAEGKEIMKKLNL